MSDKLALRQIIEIAAAALAGEDEEEGMEASEEGEAEDEGEAQAVGPTPQQVRATALRIGARG